MCYGSHWVFTGHWHNNRKFRSFRSLDSDASEQRICAIRSTTQASTSSIQRDAISASRATATSIAFGFSCLFPPMTSPSSSHTRRGEYEQYREIYNMHNVIHTCRSRRNFNLFALELELGSQCVFCAQFRNRFRSPQPHFQCMPCNGAVVVDF